MQRKLRLSGVFAVATLAVLWAGPARAYLDDAATILASVAAKRAALKPSTLVAEGFVPGAEPTVRVWTALLGGKSLRTELRGSDETRVELLIGRDLYRFRRDEAPTPPTRLRAAPLLELLGDAQPDPGGQRGRALLARMRVDPEVVSLSRFDGRPAFILGALPGQLDRPQLWIDKRYRVPVRWIMQTPAGLEEVRLLGYGMPTTGPWFPEQVQTWRGGELVQVVQYTDARLNESVEARLFSVPGGR